MTQMLRQQIHNLLRWAISPGGSIAPVYMLYYDLTKRPLPASANIDNRLGKYIL